MIRSFADKETEQFFYSERSKRLPPDIIRRAIKKLALIDSAAELFDLRMPPGNRLEALSGGREGQYSIRINEQWRICFTLENGARDVEITDYH